MKTKLFTYCTICHEQIFTPLYTNHVNTHLEYKPDGQHKEHSHLPENE